MPGRETERNLVFPLSSPMVIPALVSECFLPFPTKHWELLSWIILGRAGVTILWLMALFSIKTQVWEQRSDSLGFSCKDEG